MGNVTAREHKSLLQCLKVALIKTYLWPTNSSSMAREAEMRFHELKAAKRISHDLQKVLSYAAHCMATAFGEQLNSKIAIVPMRAFGLRKPNRVKIAICLHCADSDQCANGITQSAGGRISSCLPFLVEYRRRWAVRMSHLAQHTCHHVT